ncbi:MAG: NHL repeat-containing protein, partial [Saccharofermentanales bacterium]
MNRNGQSPMKARGILKRISVGLVVIVSVAAQFSSPIFSYSAVSPEVPYVSYVYKLEGGPAEILAPYAPVRAYTGGDFGITPFSSLADIYYDEPSRRYYLCDSGNSRIVILEKDLTFAGELVTFVNRNVREKLTEPGSVAVKNGMMYIADTGASRIIAIALDDIKPLDEGETLLRSPRSVAVYTKPAIDILGPDYTYSPNKIEVDYAGRMYVIAAGINQGLIQLEENGNFMGFLGAPRVVPRAADIFWRKFYSDEQKKRIFKFVPTEYNSVQIDDKGFFYVSSQTVSIPPISRLNSQGENILKRRNVVVLGGSVYPDGDGSYTDQSGKAIKNYFLDVESKSNGMYLGLDSNNGKIFAYDRDGLLLYAFGGIGSQVGTFYSPSAMVIVDDRILVTDYAKATLTVFEITRFGETVENAIESHRLGDYDLSRRQWNEVLSMASNYETADIGLARIEIQNREYESALRR